MGVKVPEIQIIIGGQNLEAVSGCRLGTVNVELDMDSESSASIEISNGYEVKNSRINSKMKSALLPGSKVEIQMGYAGNKGKIFAGYLDSLTLSADQEHPYLLQLQAYDAIKLMKESRHCRILTEQKHSDVFASILDAYKWTGIGTSQDDTSPYETAKCWYQNDSDYDFIMRELVERCPGEREFYLSAGTAYYKKPDDSKKAAEICITSGILGFRATGSFLKRAVKVYGSSLAFAAYTGSADAVAGRLAGGVGKGTETLVNPDADSQDLADAIAAARAKRLMRQSRKIQITLEGNQALLAGSYVTVLEIDSIWNGTYRIRRAIHSCDENGYQTEITLEGS